MKTVSKLLSLMLVLAILLTLTISSASAADVVLRGMHWNSSTVEHERYQKTFDAFMAANPNIEIQFEWFPTGFAEKLVALFADGSAPDFFATYVGDLGQRVNAGFIQPITDRFNAENYNMDDLLDSAVIRYGEDIYSVLAAVTPQVLFYNKNMFDAAGVSYPTDEWTWADMLEAAKKLTIKDGDKIVQYGFQCDEYCRVWLSKFWSDGGKCFDNEDDPTKSTFNDAIGAEAAQYLLDLVQSFGVAPPPGVPGALGYREVFTNSGVAMVLDGSWMTAQYDKAEGFDLGVALVPMGKVKRGGWMAPTGMMMSATTKHPDEVWQFLKYFFGNENSIYFGGYGDTGTMAGVPVWRSAYTDSRWKAGDISETIRRQAEGAPVEMKWQGYGTWFWNYLNVGLQEVVMTGGDPVAMLDSVAARTDAEVLTEIER